MNKPKIVINNGMVTGNKVFSSFKVSDDLKPYFRSYEIYADYGVPIKADKSILNIPLISSVITLAWLTNADIYVDVLDREYLQSINLLQRIFSEMPFRNIPFTTKIHVERCVENKVEATGTAVFFSGGLDSSYCAYKHIEENPRLLMILGFDVWRSTPLNVKIWDEWREIYSRFAEKEGFTINFIRTNTREIMREGIVQRTFQGCFPEIYWTALRHAPMLLGLGAPISVGRFNKLIIAATRDKSRRPETHPFCSYPETDEKFSWADLRVKHCGYITRREKMTFIRDKLESGILSGFRPCWHPVMGLNCNNCEKCYRTMVALLLQGIDPNNCGLIVDASTFKKIKDFIMGVSEKYLRAGSNVYVGYWFPMKHSVPSEIKEDFYGSKEFLEWFRDVEL